MEVEKVVVENAGILAATVVQHGGGKNFCDVPDSIKGTEGFICRLECSDGAIIDFYAPDAQVAAQFPPEITGDTQQIIEKSISEFVRIVGDPNPFVAVIKGQAYLESLVASIITGAFAEPSALELERMTFWQKVNLCVAAGLVHNDVGHVLKEFAKIRNTFAHQLWPTFTEEELRDFLNVLRQSSRLRDRLKDIEPSKLGVYHCVWAMWIYLFEQACRITGNRSSLIEFWKHVVDIDDPMPKHITPFPPKYVDLE
jgi:hypothetical protein